MRVERRGPAKRGNMVSGFELSRQADALERPLMMRTLEKGPDMAIQPVEILLVEDNRLDVELALSALRNHRLANAVQVARDGAEALERLLDGAGEAKTYNPALILLDLRLPKVDGLTILQRIRSEPRTRDIPVFVLISSHEERHLVDRAGLSVNGFIVKPVDLDSFTEALHSIGLY